MARAALRPADPSARVTQASTMSPLRFSISAERGSRAWPRVRVPCGRAEHRDRSCSHAWRRSPKYVLQDVLARLQLPCSDRLTAPSDRFQAAASDTSRGCPRARRPEPFLKTPKNLHRPRVRFSGPFVRLKASEALHDNGLTAVCPKDNSGQGAKASLLYLPAYSPDFNPIEMAFSKFKALMRAAAPRTIANLWSTIADAIERFTPAECQAYFAAAGYDAT